MTLPNTRAAGLRQAVAYVIELGQAINDSKFYAANSEEWETADSKYKLLLKIEDKLDRMAQEAEENAE